MKEISTKLEDNGETITTKKASSSWFERQRDFFGIPFLVCCCVVYFAQGFRSLSSLSTQFMLKDKMGLEPDTMQVLLSAAALPWSLKPLYGLVSDIFPIFGQHRRPYLCFAAIVGLIAWCALAYVSSFIVAEEEGTDASTVTPRMITILLWLSNFSTAFSDVIVDAMVAERCGELARKAGENESNESHFVNMHTKKNEHDDAATNGTEGENALQSLCWSALAVGGLTGSAVGIVASSSAPLWVIFLITASCPALVLVASFFVIEEAKETSTSTAKNLQEVMWHQIGSLFDALRQPTIWRPLLFFMLQNALVPSCSQAMMFFMTDVLLFSKEFLSAQSLIAYGFLLIGTALYSRCVEGKGFSFLRIFTMCQIATTVLCLLDVLLAARITASIGVPDWMFVLGTDAVAVVLSRIAMQPFLVISARLCPVGCEASLYAMFMSIYNLGNTLSGVFGAAVISYFGVSRDNFDNLPHLLMLRAACSLLPLVLLKPLLDGVEQKKAKQKSE